MSCKDRKAWMDLGAGNNALHLGSRSGWIFVAHMPSCFSRSHHRDVTQLSHSSFCMLRAPFLSTGEHQKRAHDNTDFSNEQVEKGSIFMETAVGAALAPNFSYPNFFFIKTTNFEKTKKKPFLPIN